MADEDGWDDGSEPSEHEDQQQSPRRVKPLFRFRRNNDERETEGSEESPEEPPEEPPEDRGEEQLEPDIPQRVRPVRVVKFVPTSEDDEEAEGAGEEGPFAIAEEVEEEGPTFAIAEEAEEAGPFAIAEEAEEEESTFAVAEETEEEESTFAIAEEAVEEEFTFAIAEEVEEEGEFAFAEAEEVEREEAPSLDTAEVAFEEDESPFVMAEEVEEEAGFTEMPDESVPEVPFAVIEEAEREEVVDDGASAEEEAELGDDIQFRQEETPVKFQEGGAAPAQSQPPDEAVQPHYHKYLKPDEELLERRPTKGRPTGFDRDLESEAGEIDFGIDLIDPSERKKKRAPARAQKEPGQQKKGAVGGHDFDAEVGTRELGVDIGVDYTKRRKRRL